MYPKNSTWDHPGQGRLQCVKIKIPTDNHSLSTAKKDSARTDDDRSIPPLHPPVDRDQHSPPLNRPKDDSSTNNPLHNVPFPASGTPSEEHEGKAHAPGHSMGSDRRIRYRPSDTCPFKRYKEKTQAQ